MKFSVQNNNPIQSDMSEEEGHMGAGGGIAPVVPNIAFGG